MCRAGLPSQDQTTNLAAPQFCPPKCLWCVLKFPGEEGEAGQGCRLLSVSWATPSGSCTVHLVLLLPSFFLTDALFCNFKLSQFCQKSLFQKDSYEYAKTRGRCPAGNLPTCSSAVFPETMSLTLPEDLAHKCIVLKNNFICKNHKVSKRGPSAKSLKFQCALNMFHTSEGK